MRASSDLYSLVADNCSQYKMKLLDSLMNVGDERHSCTNCKHFSNDAYCKIDLYDPIVARFDAESFDAESYDLEGYDLKS